MERTDQTRRAAPERERAGVAGGGVEVVISASFSSLLLLSFVSLAT